jgi:hypothetical protein
MNCFKWKKNVKRQDTLSQDRNPKKSTDGNRFVAASGFHNDIVYYKFLNTDTYELDISKIQVWIFDKEQTCVHASDNEFKADFYIGKKLDDVLLREDVMYTFKDIHTLALSGIESKRTIMINNILAYIEGRTLYYNEDVNDVYGSMLVFIPYKNIASRKSSISSHSKNILKDNEVNILDIERKNKTFSLDSRRSSKKHDEVQIKRTLSAGDLSKASVASVASTSKN